MRKLAIYAGIAGLIAAPLTAQKSDASVARQAAPAGDANEIGGGQNTLIFILGVAAVAAAVAFLSENDDDAPISA